MGGRETNPLPSASDPCAEWSAAEDNEREEPMVVGPATYGAWHEFARVLPVREPG